MIIHIMRSKTHTHCGHWAATMSNTKGQGCRDLIFKAGTQEYLITRFQIETGVRRVITCANCVRSRRKATS